MTQLTYSQTIPTTLYSAQRPIPRKQASKEFQQKVLDLLAKEPDGLSLHTLLANAPNTPLRTAQRCVGRLVDSGVLITTGRARATRYCLADTPESSQAVLYPIIQGAWRDTSRLVMREPEASLDEIPLSTRAQETLALVTRPLNERAPVAYDPALLEDYEPNVTTYLTDKDRARLAAQGRVYADAQAAGTHARSLANRLLIDLSWNSSRLEGNTYSLLETEQLFARGAASDSKRIIDTQMILNHKVAIEFMLDNAAEIDFNRYTLLNLHAMLSDNLLADPASCGALRQMPVCIGQSSFKPADTPQQIQSWFDLFLSRPLTILLNKRSSH